MSIVIRAGSAAGAPAGTGGHMTVRAGSAGGEPTRDCGACGKTVRADRLLEHCDEVGDPEHLAESVMAS